MADEVKGFEIHLSLNAQEVSDGLKQIQAELSESQKQLKSINQQLRFDPKNTTLLADKQKVLNEIIGETKRKLDLQNQALENASKLLSAGKISSAEFKKLQEQVDRTKQSLAEFNAAQNRVNQQKWEGLERAGQSLTKLSATILAAGAALTALMKKGIDDLADGKEYAVNATAEEIQAAKDLKAVMTDIRASLASIAGTVAKEILPIAKEAAEWVKNTAVPAIKDFTEKVAAIPEPMKKIIALVASIAVVAGPAVSAIAKIGKGVSTLLGSSSSGVLGLIAAHPVIAAAIAATVVLIGYAYTHSEDFRKSLAELGETVKTIVTVSFQNLKKILEAFKPTIDLILNAAVEVLNIVLPIINQVMESIADLMGYLFSDDSSLYTVIGDIASAINTVLGPALEVVFGIIKDIFQWIKDIIDKFNELISLMNQYSTAGEQPGSQGYSTGNQIEDNIGEVTGQYIPGHGPLDFANRQNAGSTSSSGYKTYNVTIYTTADHMSLDEIDKALGNEV